MVMRLNHLWNKVHHRLLKINSILLILFSHNTFRVRGRESAFMATIEPHTLCDTFVSESLLHTITTHKQKELLSEGALFVSIYKDRLYLMGWEYFINFLMKNDLCMHIGR